MKVGDSVRKAIGDWEDGETEAAMLHACNAVDGTAAKTYLDLRVKERFTTLLRANYDILGPMGAPGVNLVTTRFPVELGSPAAPDSKPDLADVVYGIHRCAHGHGDELPAGFELIADAAGPPRITRLEVRKGLVRLSDRIIFGLLAVAVMAPVNVDQTVPDGYHLTYGGATRLPINEWWGRCVDFFAIAASDPIPLVTLDFGDWHDQRH